MFRKLFLVLSMLALAAGPVPVRANPQGVTINVNSFADELLTDGNCTLREALRAANTDQRVDGCRAGSGADLVVLPAGTFTFALTGMDEDAGLAGDLDIFSSLTLRGAGEAQTFIDADMIDRLLEILPGSHKVRLEDLTLRNGGFGLYDGDSIDFQGAGIRNQADLELVRVSLLNSSRDWAGPLLEGVGIYSSGKLRLQNATVRGSRSTRGRGGGIYNKGEMTLLDSTITGNFIETGEGPGIFNAGTALIKNSSLDWNHQDIYDNTDGGNIYNAGDFRCETCSILGGIGNEGSVIYNSGAMYLADTQVAYGTTRYGYGAAVFTYGSLTLLRSKVFDSTMRGIYGTGTLNITDSEISNNRATTWANYPDPGGGGLNFTGTATISGTLFKNNQAGTRGGAILGSGQMTIHDSTFTGNTANRFSPDWDVEFESGMGGAIYWRSGTLTVTNTTFSANQASDGGAGMFIQDGDVRLDSITMVLNESLEQEGSGGLAIVNGKLTLHNSIVAANIEWYVPDCLQFNADPLTGEPASSEVVSQGYNLMGVLNGCAMTPMPGDQWGINAVQFLDPLVAPLADNGGRTPTHALLPESPALDQGDPLICLPADQRGVPRPQGPVCDIGAFELEQAGYELAVTIDIRPGSDINKINPNSRSSVPVAILSTPGFNAPAVVDPASLTFGRSGTEASLEWAGGGARPSCQARDANGDRTLDLVCRFNVSQMGFQPGDSAGKLRGLTITGQPLAGQDSVTIRYPTSRQQDEDDTLLDLQAYMGQDLVWMPLVP